MITWQEPPPQVQIIAEADQIGRLAGASRVCSNLGYETRADQVRTEAVAFVRRVMAAGISEDDATSIFLAGAEREVQVLTAVSVRPDGQPAAITEEGARTYAEFLAQRCASASRAFPNAIIANGDEARTATAVLEIMRRGGG